MSDTLVVAPILPLNFCRNVPLGCYPSSYLDGSYFALSYSATAAGGTACLYNDSPDMNDTWRLSVFPLPQMPYLRLFPWVFYPVKARAPSRWVCGKTDPLQWQGKPSDYPPRYTWHHHTTPSSVVWHQIHGSGDWVYQGEAALRFCKYGQMAVCLPIQVLSSFCLHDSDWLAYIVGLLCLRWFALLLKHCFLHVFSNHW